TQPVYVAAQTATPEATRTVGGATLPPLRVDPALLGMGVSARRETSPARLASSSAPSSAPPQGTTAAAQAPLGQGGEPPLVMDRPVLPPLYSAYVEAGQLPAPKLKPSRALTPPLKNSTDLRPSFISADRMHGRNDVEMIAEGAAELRKIGTVLDADRLTYWHLDDEVEALGNVRLQKDQDVYTGPKLRMKVEESTGFFERPVYSMPRTKTYTPVAMLGSEVEETATTTITGRGEAEEIEFLGEGLSRLKKATYTTCAPGNTDWYAEVSDLNLDYNREIAEGADGKVVFMGMPILYSPWLDFSLNNQRKSGLLTPTLGTTSTSGTELSVPWYWNIAPNMDATITPRLMQKRGTQWNTDLQYLDYTYSGQAHVEYLPNDSVAHKHRYGYSILHNQALGRGFAGSLNLNGVSDDTYFSDLSKPASGLGQLSQGSLLRTGSLTYGATWWSASLAASRYQILQDPSATTTIAEPYSRLPQFNVAANRYDLPYGGAFNFSGEFTRFGHPTNVIGQRTILYPQLSLPMQASYLQVTPKLGMHVTRYALERQASGMSANLTRNVPIFSVDSSLVLERDANLFGRNTIQTLEPRLNYLFVPNRDQSALNNARTPINFDTGAADFNFATIFAENRYSGGDRIADANQVTATLTSRLIDPATGAELIRGLIGQRHYFTTQHVTLPGEVARTSRTADLLGALSGQVLPKTYVDTALQYNPRDSAVQRFSLGGRYQPETGKVLNAGYRYTRDLLGQIDVSGQWPLRGGWYGVGRYNYSTLERRMIESVAGVEYDGGCWVARVVVQRIATQIQRQTTSLFVQLELNGFSRLGSNPLDILKRNVPGYGAINQPAANSTFTPN
ncbi:MAG: LPS-assembly protein LptD, partial [Rhodocyclaceae bacterium]|nr:LPS-assembly protein LptD [Rhodocyclaceae bacterium]